MNERPYLEDIRKAALGTAEYAGAIEGDEVVMVIDYALELEQKLERLTKRLEEIEEES